MDAAELAGLSPLLAMGLAALIGLQHAFEPDHVAAVSTQSIRAKVSGSRRQMILGGIRASSLLGAVWGAGHATILLAFGLAAYAAIVVVDGYMWAGLEMAAGIMVAALGVSVILNRDIFRFRHRHMHSHHDGTVHSHEHAHNGIHRHTHRAYLIGLVHGLAGSGNVVALAAAGMGDSGMVLGFVLVFSAGAAGGMCLVGGLLGTQLAIAGRAARRIIRYAAGGFGILMGMIIIYQGGLYGLP